MKTKNIVINSTKDIATIVDLASRIKGDIEIETNDSAKFDASSILGLFAVNPGSAMSVKYPDTADEFDDFITTLELNATAIINN